MNKNCLPIYIVCLVHFFKPWSVCMLIAQLNFNFCYIVHKRGSSASNSLLKELRKISVSSERATGENVCAINILPNSLFFYPSQPRCFSQLFCSLFIHLFIPIKLNCINTISLKLSFVIQKLNFLNLINF